MKITVIYDNDAIKEGLQRGHGFSALIEGEGMLPLLFDTGTEGPALLYNMRVLGIDPQGIDTIVISHAHDDHTGGLSEILEINRTAELYIPSSFNRVFPGRKVTVITDPIHIRENIFSTGELERKEQSLALKTEKGIFVLTGCAHPKMESILAAAEKFGELYGIAGGFHGFHTFDAFRDLSLIYPCHCTIHKQEIRNLFKGRSPECGAGLAIEL